MKNISKFLYFYYAFLLVMIGLTTKLFLIDTNLGARFKNFNHKLLASDITFICAFIIFIVGLIFYTIKRNTKSTLNDSTILKSLLLIIPLTLVFSFTPLFTTFHSGKISDSIFGPIFSFITILGVFAGFAWIIMILFTFIKQSYKILTNK
jgi:hypothetical protein